MSTQAKLHHLQLHHPAKACEPEQGPVSQAQPSTLLSHLATSQAAKPHLAVACLSSQEAEDHLTSQQQDFDSCHPIRAVKLLTDLQLFMDLQLRADLQCLQICNIITADTRYCKTFRLSQFSRQYRAVK